MPPGPPVPPGPPAAPGAWTPPPRPGLIPLGPLGLGAILGASFRVLRRNPRPVVGFSFIIRVVVAILTIVISGVLTASAMSSYLNDLTAGNATGAITSILPSSLGSVLVALVGYIGDAILQGIIAIEVARGTVGEKYTLGQILGQARGRIGVLIGWAFAVIGAVIGAYVVVAVLIGVLFGFAGTAGAIIGGILIAVAAIGGVVVWIWIGTKVSLVPSVLVLERLTLGKAIRRSWFLTTGNSFFWRVFGIELLISVMLAIAASIISAPVTAIVEFASLAANPVGLQDPTSGLGAVTFATTVASAIVGAIIGTITAIITTASTSLLYIDLRIRKEGLDLELLRYVDARAAGDQSVPDPYLPKAPPTA